MTSLVDSSGDDYHNTYLLTFILICKARNFRHLHICLELKFQFDPYSTYNSNTIFLYEFAYFRLKNIYMHISWINENNFFLDIDSLIKEYWI